MKGYVASKRYTGSGKIRKDVNCAKLSNCSGSSWRSGAQAPYRSRLGWNAGAFRHVLSSHTGSSLLYLV